MATAGDYTCLIASTGGELGYSGLAEVILDFITYGGECNPSVAAPRTDVYLFSSGPLIVRNDGGGSYATMQGMWEGSPAQPLEICSRRLTGAEDSAHITGSNYDAFFTGTSVNPDSSIAFERTVYAPTGGGGFPLPAMPPLPSPDMTMAPEARDITITQDGEAETPWALILLAVAGVGVVAIMGKKGGKRKRGKR